MGGGPPRPAPRRSGPPRRCAFDRAVLHPDADPDPGAPRRIVARRGWPSTPVAFMTGTAARPSRYQLEKLRSIRSGINGADVFARAAESTAFRSRQQREGYRLESLSGRHGVGISVSRRYGTRKRRCQVAEPDWALLSCHAYLPGTSGGLYYDRRLARQLQGSNDGSTSMSTSAVDGYSANPGFLCAARACAATSPGVSGRPTKPLRPSQYGQGYPPRFFSGRHMKRGFTVFLVTVGLTVGAGRRGRRPRPTFRWW